MDEEDDDEGADGFAHHIRKLVLQSLQGIDVSAAAELQAQSILDAKARLEREEKSINDMLGDMDGHAYQGPQLLLTRSPSLDELSDFRSRSF